MKFNVIIKGKPTSISVDDVLIDYFGAWLVEGRPSKINNAKAHHDEVKKNVRRLSNDIDLPKNNVSQFIQAKIINLIAAPQLESIIEARGPRYVHPKRERNAESDHDPKKADELMAQITASMKNQTGK